MLNLSISDAAAPKLTLIDEFIVSRDAPPRRLIIYQKISVFIIIRGKLGSISAYQAEV